MKIFFLLIISLFIAEFGIGQCTTPGLKIESQDCENPKNLVVHSVTCTEMIVKWTGSKNQSYIVKARCTDSTTNNKYEAKVSKISSDKDGNYTAAIDVREGLTAGWSVQAVCVRESATFHSMEVNGPDANVPLCPKAVEDIAIKDTLSTNEIRVYPNPSAGYLIVEYSGKTEGNIEFRIYDVNGKIVLKTLEAGAINANNHYKLDLRSLANGLYLLEAYNGRNTRVVKFELFRK